MRNKLTAEQIIGTIFFALGVYAGWAYAKTIFAPILCMSVSGVVLRGRVVHDETRSIAVQPNALPLSWDVPDISNTHQLGAHRAG